MLSNKPYVHYREGIGDGYGYGYGYIGTQYLFDNCQKHIILYAFMEYVSTKIQQKLRNKEGKSYSVSPYTSLEFDSDSLTNLVDKTEHMRSDHHIENKTHYEFFKTITADTFKDTIKETFIDKNKYRVIYRDYLWFSGDINLFSFFVMVLIVYLYLFFSHFIFSYRGLKYTKREVLLSYRISNRFTGFMVFIMLFLLTGLIYGWLEYFIIKYMMGDINYIL